VVRATMLSGSGRLALRKAAQRRNWLPWAMLNKSVADWRRDAL
jgi:hypothetical protein